MDTSTSNIPPPGSIASLLVAGADLIRFKQYADVRALIQHLIRMQPDAAGWVGISSLYLGIADHAAALDAATRAIALAPENIGAWRCAAIAHWHLGHAHEALDAVETGLRLDSADPELLRVQASVYYAQRRYAAALATVDRALTTAPDDPHLRYFRSAIVYQMDHKAVPTKAIADDLYFEPMIPLAIIRSGLEEIERIKRDKEKPGSLRGFLSEIRDFWRVRRFTRSIRARQRHRKRRPLPNYARHR